MGVKSALARVLASPPAVSVGRRLLARRGTIFMLHRFSVPDLEVHGHSPAAVRGLLAYLRRHRFELIPLADMMKRLRGNGPLPAGAVSFTIDDGYFDHAEVGAPIFAEFDCPVTTFATTGFLDRQLWFWWDRIEHVFSQTRRATLSVMLGAERISYSWQARAERDNAQADFTARCKEVPDEVKMAAILDLASAGEVELPATAPARYAPMSWDQLRAAESRGMNFGPHTLTHPILARTSDAQSKHELTASWERLSAESRHPVPVFCYPNGRTGQDFGPREFNTLRSLDFLGAVTGSVGYSTVLGPDASPDAPYLIDRFPFIETLQHSVQYAGGIERGKQLVMGLVR